MKNVTMKLISIVLSVMLFSGCMRHLAYSGSKQEKLNTIRHLGIGTILDKSGSGTGERNRNHGSAFFTQLSSYSGDDGLSVAVLLVATIVAVVIVTIYEEIKSPKLDINLSKIYSDRMLYNVKEKFDSCLFSHLESGLKKKEIQLHPLLIENYDPRQLKKMVENVKNTYPTLDALMLLPFSYQANTHKTKGFKPGITAKMTIFNLKGEISLIENSAVSFFEEKIEDRTIEAYEADQCELFKSDFCRVAESLSKKIVAKVFPDHDSQE